ncbi:MAG: DegV family protein [Clostridia bacterium]
MINYEIFSDSSSNLNDDTIDNLQLNVVSLVYIINGEEFNSYVKGADNSKKAFFERLKNKEEITTSCINEQTFIEAFEPTLQAGKDLLYIGFSSGVSNTYNCGANACKNLQAKYPSRKIIAVDTLSGSLGEGLIVNNACEMRLNGSTIEDVASYVENVRLNVIHVFTVEDLYWLYKGGRINRSTFLIGSIAKIKPIMDINNEGKIVSAGKSLGRKKSIIDMANIISKSIVNPEEQIVYISHGDCFEDVELLEKKILEKIQVKGFYVNDVDQVMGVHAGPGLLGAYFVGGERHQIKKLF